MRARIISPGQRWLQIGCYSSIFITGTFEPRFGQGRNRHVASVFAVAGIGSWKIERLRLAEISRRHFAARYGVLEPEQNSWSDNEVIKA